MNTRKLLLTIAILVMAASLTFAFASCAKKGGEEGGTSATANEWNISSNENSEVTAKLSDNGTLTVSGRGFMKDFRSASDTPWHGKNITSVVVEEGIKSVGSYAYFEAQIDSVLLPSTINYADDSFVAEGVKVLLYSDEVDFYCEKAPEIYVYGETIPETKDRFWQSDKTQGNIIDSGEVLPELANLWTFDENDQPKVAKMARVLFIGNSFTYRNGVVEYSSGVPGIFDNIAEDLGFAVETYSITGPGWYLDNHAKSTDTYGKQIDLILNATDDFDYVVLQEQSVTPFENYSRFLSGVKALAAKIEATQKHAEIILYETWGSPFSANERKITIEEMEAKLRKAYEDASEECGYRISYVGKAFTKVYTENPSIYLWASDNRHQGYTGAYLSACVHVANILGGDVRKTTFKGEAKYSAPTLAEETYEVLRKSAYNVVFGIEEPVVATPDSSSQSAPDSSQDSHEAAEGTVTIACWGRFMTQKKFDLLTDAFKKYLADNNISYTKVVANYYVGATNTEPYYYIADFTAKIVADGGADIVLPCADNFNANQSNLAAISLTPIEVYGKTDRRVGVINDGDLSAAYIAFIGTDAAKTILSTKDEDLGKTPASADSGNSADDGSSASTESGNSSQEATQSTLVVACWGRFMKEAKFGILIDAFKSYLADNNIAYTDVVANYYAGAVNGEGYYRIADFTTKIVADGGADIVLPCAENFNTNQQNMQAKSFTPIEVYGQTDRRVGLIREGDLSSAFLSFIVTDEAKAILAQAD